MAELTLLEVFGPNTQEDADFIYISKAEMANVGLTVNESTTGEAYFAAIVAIAQLRLNQENQDTNLDQSIVIEDGFPSLISRNGNTYRQINKNIIFEKIDTQTTFDPDDY
ncbi:MAG: hypothetical protein WBA07_13065 [Rivularia sp. (in: cyanobacteria)]